MFCMNDFFHGRDPHRAKEQIPHCKTYNILKQKIEGVNKLLNAIFFIHNLETKKS